MDDTPHHSDAPPDWLQALAESDDDLAAGRIVPGQVASVWVRPANMNPSAILAARP
jgi:hypothetical protein